MTIEKKQQINEVNSTLGGERKAIYAQNENGSVNLTTSMGNKVEETVTTQALDEFRNQSLECLQRVKAGLASTLEYHMYAERMDLITLAQSAGIFQWRVRRHLRPKIFAHLKPTLLIRYAEALGLSCEELTTLPPEINAPSETKN